MLVPTAAAARHNGGAGGCTQCYCSELATVVGGAACFLTWKWVLVLTRACYSCTADTDIALIPRRMFHLHVLAL
jgi:hypothetical protein